MADFEDKEIIDITLKYLEKGEKLGYTVDQLKKNLLSKGYPKNIVEKAINIYEKTNSKKDSDVKKNNQSYSKPNELRKKLALITIVFLVAMLGTFAINAIVNHRTVCDDSTCFIEKANSCKNAIYEVAEDYGTFRFISHKNCTTSKEIVSLASGEPYIIKDLLESKSLTCEYKKDLFDERIVLSLINGLENCEGDLKDSLYELAIVEYEIFLEEM